MKEKSQFKTLMNRILLEVRDEYESEGDWSSDRVEAENEFGEDYQWSDEPEGEDPWSNDDDDNSAESMKNLFKSRLEACKNIQLRKYLTNWRDCWGSATELAGVYGAKPKRKDAFNWVEKLGNGIYTLCSVAGFEKMSPENKRPLKGYRVEAIIRFYKQKGNLYLKLVEMKQFHPDGKGTGRNNHDYYNITKWAGGKRIKGDPVLEAIKDYVESETGPIS